MSHRLPWPLPALLSWAAAWLLFLGLQALGLSPALALLTACTLGVVLARLGHTPWRRLFIAMGFPLSWALLVGQNLPTWAWLLPLLVLLLLYPLNAWRDAPLFPTPRQALRELERLAPLSDGALVLDAGCGLGHGLIALRQAYPKARLHGLEWSWPLRWASALWCPWARVRHGDIWAQDWHPYALVYLFQRPESMSRAAAKAQGDLAPGAWLVSLEFEASSLEPTARADTPDGRTLWLYQAPLCWRNVELEGTTPSPRERLNLVSCCALSGT